MKPRICKATLQSMTNPITTHTEGKTPRILEKKQQLSGLKKVIDVNSYHYRQSGFESSRVAGYRGLIKDTDFS